ncbi:MAG: hypothetical protein ACREOH_15925 [Candidatus Entotheonellia bacterium]
MGKTYVYRVVIEQDDDRYHAEIPALPALLSGATAEGRSHPRGSVDVLDIERARRTLKPHAAIDGPAVKKI